MLKTAKDFHRIGFAIHWLRPKSKAPIESKWTTGARKDWATLKKTYKKDFNIGVRLGKASQIGEYFLAVIDCDVKSSDKKYLSEMNSKLAELLSTKGPCVMSGRGNGSSHHYIKTSEPVTPFRFSQSPSKVKVFMPSVAASEKDKELLSEVEIKKGFRMRPAWEISVMGEGQQVVMPPSIHPDSGKPYTWKTEFEVEALPLIEFDSHKSQTKLKRSSIEDFDFEEVDLFGLGLSDEIIGLITKGDECEDRSADLFKAARALVNIGLNDRQVLSVLTDKDYFLGETGFDHAKTTSRKRAARWVHDFTLRKVRKDLSLDDLFNDEADFSELSDTDAETQTDESLARAWHLKLERNKEDGNPRATFRNVKLILQNTIGFDCVAHNEFTVSDFWTIETPWGAKKDAVVTDVDSIHIKDWLIHHYRVQVQTALIDEVIIHLSHKNKFHPVRKFLRGLEWDGAPRVETWLENYLEAHGQSKEYLRALGPLILVGMVARIFEPGVKFDWVPILEGKQGVGKSTTARVLAGDKWFSDTTLNLGDKDAVVGLQGNWVVELGELSVMSRHDANSLKEFVARTIDKIRPPYGKRMLEYPRQCIFIGTTNRDEYLKDDTGARRFMPIQVGDINTQHLRKDRDQLLAEAVEMYLNNYSIGEEGKRCEILATPENKKRLEHDEIESAIAEKLLEEQVEFNVEYFRVLDLLNYVDLGVKNDRQSQMRIASALKKLGYSSEQKMVKGIKARWWSKKSFPT